MTVKEKLADVRQRAKKKREIVNGILSKPRRK
jgi:hypothetical protein